jgi:hypothetical protein
MSAALEAGVAACAAAAAAGSERAAEVQRGSAVDDDWAERKRLSFGGKHAASMPERDLRRIEEARADAAKRRELSKKHGVSRGREAYWSSKTVSSFAAFLDETPSQDLADHACALQRFDAGAHAASYRDIRRARRPREDTSFRRPRRLPSDEGQESERPRRRPFNEEKGAKRTLRRPSSGEGRETESKAAGELTRQGGEDADADVEDGDDDDDSPRSSDPACWSRHLVSMGRAAAVSEESVSPTDAAACEDEAPAPVARTYHGKIPYRRRGPKALQAARPCAMSDSYEGTEEMPRRFPMQVTEQTTLYYELPPILVTNVTFVSQSDEERESAQRFSANQDQFTYLSSEEDEDQDELCEMVRESSRTLGLVDDQDPQSPSFKDATSRSKASKETQAVPWGNNPSKYAIGDKLDAWEAWGGDEVQHACSRDRNAMFEGATGAVSCAETKVPVAQPLIVNYQEKFSFTPKGATFIDRFDCIKRQEFAEGYWPEYKVDVDMDVIEIRAQAAFAAAVAKSECPSELQACKKKHNLYLDRFLENYFMDPEAFEVDTNLCVEILNGSYRSRCFGAKEVQRVMLLVPDICRSCLLTAVHNTASCELPDEPLDYLATALRRVPVCKGRKAPCTMDEEKRFLKTITPTHSPRSRFDEVRNAVMRHATGMTVTLDELENVLCSTEGLPWPPWTGESLVCLAASYNDAGALAKLFEYGLDLNEAQAQGGLEQTALETSSLYGHEAVVSLLLANGGASLA